MRDKLINIKDEATGLRETGGTVTATRGNSSSNDIGRGSDDTSCGTITVSSNVKTSDGKSYYSGTKGYNHN